MIYYINEGFFNKKNDAFKNQIINKFDNLKKLLKKSSDIKLSYNVITGRYRYTNENDPNFEKINQVMNSLQNDLELIDKKYNKDKELNKLKKEILDFLGHGGRE